MIGEPGPRAVSAWWLRAPLALAASTAFALLASRRPALPALLAPVKPTAAEEVRGTVVLIAWVLLLLISVALAWHAVRPPRRGQSSAQPEAPPRPPRRGQPPLLVPSSPELLALFASPRLTLRIRPAEPAAAAPSSPAAGRARLERDDRPVEGVPRMLRLFGPLSIDGSGRVGLSQRPTRGLIAYLALKRGPASPDELLEALWPGLPPAGTRSRLWRARRQAEDLLGEALQRHRDGYRLDRRALPCDSDEIEHLQQGQPDRDRLERALALIGGEPLLDIDYPWADTGRRRLQAVRGDTLAKVAAARLEDGDRSGALTAAERLIELEPLNEEGWRLAMRAEAALGQRQAILDRYQELARELDDLLGLRPAAETREIYHRLLGQE